MRNNIYDKLMILGTCIGCHQRPERSFFIKDINSRYVPDALVFCWDRLLVFLPVRFIRCLGTASAFSAF